MLQPEPPILMRSEITVRLRDAAGRLVPAPVGGRMRTLRHWWLGTAPIATLPTGLWTLERIENGVVTQSATFQVVAGSRITTPFR